jgi:hypothetical protein
MNKNFVLVKIVYAIKVSLNKEIAKYKNTISVPCHTAFVQNLPHTLCSRWKTSVTFTLGDKIRDIRNPAQYF